MKAIYIVSNGLSLRYQGQTLRIERAGKKVRQAPLREIKRIVIYGQSDISPSLIAALLNAGIPLHYLRRNFYMRARLSLPICGRITTRLAQYRYFSQYPLRLTLGREFIAGEIKNMTTAIERFQPPANYEHILNSCRAIEEILGVESRAARQYYRLYAQALPIPWQAKAHDDNIDRVHFLLNLGYKCLLCEIEESLCRYGLDPFLGALWPAESRMPSLALDLMSELRQHIDLLIADILAKGLILSEDFQQENDEQELKENGLKKFFSAFEGMLLEGREKPLQKIIDYQVKLLGKHLANEQNYCAYHIGK